MPKFFTFGRSAVLRWHSHILALLLSIATHMGLFHVVERADMNAEQAAAWNGVPAAILPVHLIRENGVAVESEQTLQRRSAETVPFHEDAQSESVHRSNDKLPAVPILAPSEPYYFLPSELSEKPHILQDVLADLILILPDMSPQPAVLRLYINEGGDVDKVVIDEARLSEQARQFLTDAFAKMKFHPGLIDDMPVKSQMRIEVNLESAGNP